MKDRFIKLPIERAAIWEELSWFQRALGADMFRVFQEREHVYCRAWEQVICGALCVPGRERGNVIRALREMVAAGVVVVTERSFRLLYSEASFRDVHSTSAATPPDVRSTSAQRPPDVHSTSTATPPDVHQQSTTRNDSTQVLQIDREIERKTDTQTRARDPQRSEQSEWDAQAYAASVPTRFRKLYHARFNVDCAVGGSNVGDFPERLANTARAQGIDPLALLERLFGAWCDLGRPGVADKHIPPYSAFVTRFDALAAPAAPTLAKATPEQQLATLRKQNIALMEAGDFGPEYQRVNDEIQALQRELDPPRGGEPRRAFGGGRA